MPAKTGKKKDTIEEVEDRAKRNALRVRQLWLVFGYIQMSTAAVAALLALSVLATVLLVFASRRATLKQLNVSLMALADEARRLRPTDGS